MQNVNKQLENGSIIHRCSYYKHILVHAPLEDRRRDARLTMLYKIDFQSNLPWLNRPQVKSASK